LYEFVCLVFSVFFFFFVFFFLCWAFSVIHIRMIRHFFLIFFLILCILLLRCFALTDEVPECSNLRVPKIYTIFGVVGILRLLAGEQS
jgi:hypothetical protein